MTFDQLPLAARKVLAFRATFCDTFGFTDGQVFIGPAMIPHGPPPPPGHVWLTAVIAVGGDQARPDFAAIAGYVPTGWNPDLMIPAWNRLSQEERHAARIGGVTEAEVAMMALTLTSRGIVPPTVLAGIGLPPPGRN